MNPLVKWWKQYGLNKLSVMIEIAKDGDTEYAVIRRVEDETGVLKK